MTWWEDCHVDDRSLAFVAYAPWLTLCALVCEDLARPDPVGEIVRAVGPNLVVALLMDAPQLDFRWPGRYATVLADDPGCSVLTVSSLGMVDLSRPPAGIPRSRAVALWKDAKDKKAHPLELPEEGEALILNLAGDYFEEFSADGRRDDGATAYPVLAGVHIVERAT
jgi:hypothetical protein